MGEFFAGGGGLRFDILEHSRASYRIKSGNSKFKMRADFAHLAYYDFGVGPSSGAATFLRKKRYDVAAARTAALHTLRDLRRVIHFWATRL